MDRDLVSRLIELLSGWDKKYIAVEQVEKKLSVYRDTAIALLKEQADQEMSVRFLLGRKGYPTRLEADYALKEVYEKRHTGKGITESETKNSTSSLHRLVLRNDPKFEVLLPLNLTEEEADRIARFAKAVSC